MVVTKVAIVGFTGKLATLITKFLVAKHPTIQIHGISRTLSKVDATNSSNPKIKLFEAASTDTAALHAGITGTDVCICCYLGSHELMVEGQKTLIDVCIAEKVPRYIASDWSLDYRPLKLGDLPPKDPMKIIYAYLQEKKSEIKAVHVLNGMFMEVIVSPFGGWIDIPKGQFNYFATGDEKIEMTCMADTAAFTAEIAADETATGVFNYLGDSKSVKEVAAIYEKVYGVKPQIAREGSLEELYSNMTAAFKAEPGNMWAWMAFYYQYYMTNGSTLLGNLDNDRYHGIVPTAVEAFMRAHKK